MAKKRSKRASKTSPARSKRRGKARAAATEVKPRGVVNAWEQDPGDGAQPSGGQVIQRPVPVLREQPFSIRIVNPASAPEAKPHRPGTAEFRYWTAAEALRRGADFWGALLPGISWEVGSILPVDLDFGVDLNAFYDREGLKFFHGTGAGRTPLNRMPGLALATIDASVALRTWSGSRRRSSPFNSIRSKAWRKASPS